MTILSCCFYGCHRLSELILKDANNEFDWRKIIKRSLVFVGSRVSYRLPYHKTDRSYRGTYFFFFCTQQVADPVTLLKSFVTRRDQIHGAHATLFIHEDGSFSNHNWFDKKFFALLDRHFGGYSLRAGGATCFASLGLSEDIIQVLSRWSPKAWNMYIRDNPTIRAELQLARLRLRC